MEIKLESARKIPTQDSKDIPNGYIIELQKDGKYTTAYLTAIKPGMMKGFHLHKVRQGCFVCVQGKVKVITYKKINYLENGVFQWGWKREEFILEADPPSRINIPADIAIGLKNIGQEDALIINFPDPPYNPDLKDEQIEYTLQELEGKP